VKITASSTRNHRRAERSIFLFVTVFLLAVMGYGGTCGPYNPIPPSENLEIRDWYDLDDVRNNLAGNHTLMNDLDSTTAGYTELASPTANGGKGWQPVGKITGVSGTTFAGTVDGQGYVICDLFINRPDEMYVGLFGSVYEGGIIKNIGVVNATVTGKGIVGGLVGSNYVIVSNSYSKGSVTGGVAVGGLIGDNRGTVSDCYSSGNVTGDGAVGGLVGWNRIEAAVSNSYSSGNVTCILVFNGLAAGGLVGWNHGATLTNSYSTSSVTGYITVGGLVGRNEEGTVSNCYSTGSVTGNSSVGGLVGTNDGTVSKSFWDTETSGQATSDGGIGKTMEQMKNITTFSGAEWNIIAVALNETNTAYIWNIVNYGTYPFLSWQP
jgi:hypothetical protein